MNLKKLRADLIHYYETQAYSGMPAYLINASEVKYASEEKLIRMANEAHLDLKTYQTNAKGTR